MECLINLIKTMKKLSLLLVLLTLLCSSIFSFANTECFMQQSKKKKEITIKSTTGVPIFRSPIYSPVQAFIGGNVLTINFQESIEDVLVQIENIETNEVILLKFYNAKIGEMYDINVYESGKFRISFAADTYEGYGEFIVYE